MKDIIDTFVAPPCLEKIEILYKDESLLLLSKPSGLLSLSGKNPLNNDSVHRRIIKEYPTATLAHRLDFGTSGIMVAPLTKQANASITQQFEQRKVAKRYRAVLSGHLEKNQGVIDYPIAKDNAIFPRVKICPTTGKRAISHYWVDERLEFPRRSVVFFRPATGRTHQLRIHAQAIGHSILGCDLYGDKRSQHLANRLMLHAESLEFIHPTSGKIMQAVCPCSF